MRNHNFLKMIGSTPLFEIEADEFASAFVYAKAEFFNPSGSIKDRIVHFIIEEAERKGTLRKGMTIVEASSGNTGIAAAFIGLAKSYPVKIVMPENMSKERRQIIRALNAELILTPARKNVAGAIEELERIKHNEENVFMLGQFTNPDNWKAHYLTTAWELWEQLNHKIDIFVSGIGSGGTLMGIGKFLKEKNPETIIAAAEPMNSSVILGHEPGLHKIEGIGDGFIPQIVDTDIIDQVIEVSDEDAIQMSKKLAKQRGLLVGISAGANVWAAHHLGKKYKKAKVIATILPDRADRYYSTELFNWQSLENEVKNAA